MRSFLILFLLLALAIVLFATNPETDDFRAYVEASFEEQWSSESPLERAFAGLVSGPVGALTEGNTRRINAYIASVYVVQVGDSSYRYLGIAAHFIPLQTANPLKPETGNP